MPAGHAPLQPRKVLNNPHHMGSSSTPIPTSVANCNVDGNVIQKPQGKPAHHAAASGIDIQRHGDVAASQNPHHPAAARQRQQQQSSTPAPGLASRTLPSHQVTHPKGFKVLSKTSALERSLVTYFRLPPPPPKHIQSELQRVQRKLQQCDADARREARRNAAAVVRCSPQSSSDPSVLDGFRLLEMCSTSDPEDAVEACLVGFGFRSAVSEDMRYFERLEFVDAGENYLALGAFARAPSLQELHLHCNAMSDLQMGGLVPYMAQHRIHFEAQEARKAQLQLQQHSSLEEEEEEGGEGGDGGGGEVALPPPQPAPVAAAYSPPLFPCLDTLNLSYNSLPGAALPELFELYSLTRLDLSYNPIVSLPPDLSPLRRLQRLALEKCGLDSACFASLLTLPEVVEVNLNHNLIKSVDLVASGVALDSASGQLASQWPHLATIGLVSNPIRQAKGLLDLLRVKSLRRAVCWGTLPEKHTRVMGYAMQAFDGSHVKIELSPPQAAPAPPAVDLSRMVAVRSFTPKTKLFKRNRQQQQPAQTQRRETTVEAEPPAAHPPPPSAAQPSAPGFFLTEADTELAGGGGSGAVVASEVTPGRLGTPAALILRQTDAEIAEMHQRRRAGRGGGGGACGTAQPLPTVGAALVELKRALRGSFGMHGSGGGGGGVSQRGAEGHGQRGSGSSTPPHPSASSKGIHLPPMAGGRSCLLATQV